MNQDRRPVIGLSTYAETARMLVWEREFAMLHASYIAAVRRAGGIAVLLPPQDGGADEVLSRVDGLVLAGGADVDPRALRRRPPTSGPHGPARCATSGNSRWPGPRSTATFRCSPSAAGCRYSTSRSAARCTSTCPTSPATRATSRGLASSARSR